MSGGLKGINFFYNIESGISITEPFNYVIYYAVITLILVLNLIFGKRAFCKYMCWVSPFMIIGRKIRNIFKYPSLKLKSEKSKCISCMKCSEECPMSINVNQMVQRSNMENYECTLCGSCVDICPNKVIGYGL